MLSDNNQRILRNTLFLYARMLIVLAVSLFTVRVTLGVLGAEDYGIYNVVGGVVTMFSFLISSMSSASQRFFSFSLGKKDYEGLSRYFTMSLWCYILFTLLVVVLAETVGLWFVLHKLVIPAERMKAAVWVYHFAVIGFAFSLLSVPYNAIIIAREKMNIFAIFGLLEAFGKLGIAYLLMIAGWDKLIVYSALICVLTTGVYTLYIGYGLVHYAECRPKRLWDKQILHEVMGYSGWSFLGAVSEVICGQGINILLNMFFGPVVNAARAIAYQINTAINNFVLNFFKAAQPQIIKYHAVGEQESLMQLIMRTSRFCFYLILFLSSPVLIEAPFILSFWLHDVPEYTVLFTRLVILIAIVDSVAYPLQTSVSATGHIKWYQIVVGGLVIMNLPVSYVFLRMGYPPETTMYVALFISLLAHVLRIAFARHYNHMSVRRYLCHVVWPISLVSVVSFLPIYILSLCFSIGWTQLLIVGVASVLWTPTVIGMLGMTRDERTKIIQLIRQRILRLIPNNPNKE